ncbi:hypothetical protein BuS5_00768 [Desulfosarcina sp. BuS5]|nr:hypothetical protein BuS5_00768 [Desulfosarcina sp. BuS5]
MREIFTYGSVGGASGNRCSYLELDRCSASAPQRQVSFVDKLTVSSATLRTRSTYRRLSSSSNVLDRFRSRSTYQGRSSRLRFSTLNEKKPPFSFSACDSRGSTAGVMHKKVTYEVQ